MAAEYTTVSFVAGLLGITDTDDNPRLSSAIRASSRVIDGICGRSFTRSAAGVVRQYLPEWGRERWPLPIDDCVTLTKVEVSPGSDGVWEELASTNWQLEPLNAATDIVEAKPYTDLRRVDSMPWTVSTTGRPTVRLTGTWGWPTVPEGVIEACQLLAVRWYKRQDSPLGVQGFGDLGIAYVKANDPDVVSALVRYRNPRAMVG